MKHILVLLCLVPLLAGALLAQTPTLTPSEQKDLKILQLQQQVLAYQAQQIQEVLAKYNEQRQSFTAQQKAFVSTTLKEHKLDPKKYTLNLQSGVIVPLTQKPSATRKAAK